MVVVFPMNEVVSNANVEPDGQVVDVIKVDFPRIDTVRSMSIDLLLRPLSVSSYCAKYNPCVSI